MSQIPLYPDEDRIAVEVMGPKRAKEWPAKAKYLEDKHGLPRIDPLMGGRHWPSVVEFFRVLSGGRARMALDGPGDDPGKISSRVRVVPFKPDRGSHGEETQAAHGRRATRRGAREGARVPAHHEG